MSLETKEYYIVLPKACCSIPYIALQNKYCFLLSQTRRKIQCEVFAWLKLQETGHGEPAPTSTPPTGCPYSSLVDEPQLS